MNNPSVGISDIENIELQYPLVYFSRNHMIDSGGFGKFRGGLGMQRIIMVRGSDDLTVNYSPYHGIPGGWGLFGGSPMGIGGSKFVVDPDDLEQQMAASRYPVAFADVPSWGTVLAPKLAPLARLKIPAGQLIADPVEVGSGYGDPLDRDPAAVLRDIETHACSERIASDVYGVVIAGAPPAVDAAATERRRAELRDERRRDALPVTPGTSFAPDPGATRLRRVHEYVELATAGDGSTVSRCVTCAHVYGAAERNYKLGAVRRKRSPNAASGMPLPDGSPYLAEMHEYFCPGCLTLVDVEVHCPSVESDDAPVWDIRLTAADVAPVPAVRTAVAV
jgi:hypothetical protein